MAYIDTFTLWSSANLRNRTTVAVAIAAQDVLNESPTTANHTKRLAWAQFAQVNPFQESERFMWAVVSNPTIAVAGEACTDNDIQFVVNSNIDIQASGRF